MNKTLLKGMALGLGMLAIAGSGSAQKAITFDGNHANDYVGARFIVNNPPSIAGAKDFEIANDGSGTAAQWGAQITTPFINIAVAKAYDTLGINPLLNNGVAYPTLNGKVALIFRGAGITFTRKAKLCQDAGAKICLIVNNVPGGPVGMGYTAPDSIGIPVIMISDIDGQAINNQLLANIPVTLTITKWGVNLTHDLAILSHGSVLPHAAVIPKAQLGTANGNPIPYKNQTAAYIANFGNSNENNVKLKSTTSWTPTGGTASVLHSDSISIATFLKADSILIPFVNNTYDLHATSTGRFDFRFQVAADSNDQNIVDNTITESMYVSDTIYSKSRFDFANKHPIATSYNQFNSGGNYVIGPLYYIAKGGYQVKSIQIAVSDVNGTTDLSNFGPLNVSLFRWTDTDHDSIMITTELVKVGSASKIDFSTNDSSQRFYTLNMTDANTGKPLVKVEDTGWYWLAADMPGGKFIGCDGLLNYMPRTYIRSRTSSSDRTIEMFAPSFDGSGDDIDANPGLVRPIALESFIRGSFPDSARYSVQRNGLVPSISMNLSANTVGIKQISPSIGNISLYPNPASDVINVSMHLIKPSANVYASITDGFGRTINTLKYNNVQNQIIQFSTVGLSSGQYYMVVNTDQGPLSSKFTVVAK